MNNLFKSLRNPSRRPITSDGLSCKEKYFSLNIGIFLFVTLCIPLLLFGWPGFLQKTNSQVISQLTVWFGSSLNKVFYALVVMWAYAYIWGKYVLYPLGEAKIKYIRINEFAKFHLLLTGTCFGLISFFLGQYNDKLNFYAESDHCAPEEETHSYCWFSPKDVLRFPITQLKYLGENGDSLIDEQRMQVKNAKFPKSPFFHNIILSDFSLSTEDKESEKDLNGLPFLLFQHLKNTLGYDISDTSLKKNIPLILINEYSKSKNHQTGNNFDFYYYDGLANFKSMKRSKEYLEEFQGTNSISEKPMDSLGSVYTSFLKKSIDSSRRSMQSTRNYGRTDFKFIANQLYNQIPDKKYYDKTNYISLTIISDFLHDDSLRKGNKKIPFSEVKDSLEILFSKKAIKQINLLIIPSVFKNKEEKEIHDAKINKLIGLFKYEGINLYTHKLDLYDQKLTNDIDAVNKILAITSNYEEDSLHEKIYFYHPYNYFTSRQSLSSKLVFDKEDSTDTSFIIGLRSSIPLNDDIRLEIEKNHNAKKFVLALNEYKNLTIAKGDIFSCNLNFNSNNAPVCDLYVDVYSINKKIKKTYPIIQRPTIPLTLCRCLLFLYTLLISSLTIYLLFITVEMQRIKTKGWLIKSAICFLTFIIIGSFHLKVFLLYIPTLWFAKDNLTAFSLVGVNVFNWLIAFQKYAYFSRNSEHPNTSLL